MEPVRTLRNIGKRMEAHLHRIGIYTRNDLEQRGALSVFRELKEKNIITHPMAYYALEGALADINCFVLARMIKEEKE